MDPLRAALAIGPAIAMVSTSQSPTCFSRDIMYFPRAIRSTDRGLISLQDRHERLDGVDTVRT